MNSIKLIASAQCTGCGICSYACPSSCITMEYDEEGFLNPCIEEVKCVGCGSCMDICPVLESQKERVQGAYVCRSKNAQWTKKSSSGGLFPLLAMHWIQKGGYVCGACMTEDFTVVHGVTNQLHEIELMQGSKYVQSSIRECLPQIENLLKQKIPVLFVGTPCQVSSVKNLWKEQWEKGMILFVDLVCHGIASPEFFKEHINRSYNKEKNLKEVTFRDTTPYVSSMYRFTFTWERRKKKTHILPEDDAYYSLFLQDASFRESCYQCIYAEKKRCGDLTIGDCASSRFYRGHFEHGVALSTLLINTKAGQELWDGIRSDTGSCEMDYKREAELNPQLSRPASRPETRDFCYKDFKELEAEQFRRKYTFRQPYYKRLVKKVSLMIPLKAKGIIRKVLGIMKGRKL